jgi:hypothetical protein
MMPGMKPRWTYGLGLIPLASLMIAVLPSYSGQQSGGQMSSGKEDQQAQQGQPQQGQQAQQQQNQRRSQDGQWQSVSGFVRKMRKFDVGNGERQNLVVQVQTDDGRHQTIDLGDAEDLEDFKIERGHRIAAWGKTKTISGRQLLMAKKLNIDGEKINIDRPELSQSSQQQARQQIQDQPQQGEEQDGHSMKKIRGQVVGAGEVVAYDRVGNVVESESDAFYIVEEPNGRQAELLVGEDMDPWLHVGDSIEATVAPDGRVVAISREMGGSDRQDMQQSNRGGQGQRNRQEQYSQQQSGQQRQQDQARQQQPSGQQQEQTARQSQDERQ